MTIPRSASMMPSLRRSRSASMSSLAQVDLSTLDPDIVLDYARKVMQLQLQPATSGEKLQMLFALSQKLMKWFLEDREQLQNRLKVASTLEKTESSLLVDQVEPLSFEAHVSKEPEKPSVASRILASVAPIPASGIKLAHEQETKDPIVHTQSLPTRPAESSIKPTRSDKMPDHHCQKTAKENEPLVPTSDYLLVQETIPKKTDALQVYMQVQRSVICMQKYVRGFTARRRFFKALEELLRGGRA